MNNKYQIIRMTICAMSLLIPEVTIAGGDLAPTNAPAPSMHTLEDIYQKVANLAPQDLQVLSDAVSAMQAGYYASTNLAQVDIDLAGTNIRSGVTIFGVTGTWFVAGVQKTGQTTSYEANDDGALQVGVAWPSPRFTVGADTNVVLDNMTGLMWARNANMFGQRSWANALLDCTGLDYGGYSDWRLPNRFEQESLLNLGTYSPALPAGHPFNAVENGNYWSSSTAPDSTAFASRIDMGDGPVKSADKTELNYVWPVRGGQ